MKKKRGEEKNKRKKRRNVWKLGFCMEYYGCMDFVWNVMIWYGLPWISMYSRLFHF